MRSNVARRISVRLSAGGLGFMFLLLQLRQDEIVDGRLGPRRVLHLGHAGFRDRLPGPVIFAGILPRFLRAVSDARIGRAHFDPGFEIGDLLGGKLLVLRRHLQIRIGVAHRLDEQAFLRIAGHDGRAGLAAFQSPLARIEEQAAFDLLRLALWHL